jgi:hypothetical protein
MQLNYYKSSKTRGKRRKGGIVTSYISVRITILVDSLVDRLVGSLFDWILFSYTIPTELDESLGDIHGLIVGKNPRLEKDHYNALKLSELF